MQSIILSLALIRIEKEEVPIKYDKGSWRPDDTTGRKLYSKEFLMQFKSRFKEAPSGYCAPIYEPQLLVLIEQLSFVS